MYQTFGCVPSVVPRVPCLATTAPRGCCGLEAICEKKRLINCCSYSINQRSNNKANEVRPRGKTSAVAVPAISGAVLQVKRTMPREHTSGSEVTQRKFRRRRHEPTVFSNDILWPGNLRTCRFFDHFQIFPAFRDFDISSPAKTNKGHDYFRSPQRSTLRDPDADKASGGQSRPKQKADDSLFPDYPQRTRRVGGEAPRRQAANYLALSFGGCRQQAETSEG